MQTKNVNLPQPADCSAPLSSETNHHHPPQPPPPLPPRGPGQQLNPADGAAPKPVPPPYRQPPNPQGPLGVTPLSTAEGLIPGMMMAATSASGETLANFVTHSAKYPVSRERDTGAHASGVVEKKIPLLAEVASRVGPTRREQSPNAAPNSPRANAWADKRHQPRPLHQRLRTLLSHSPIEHNREQQQQHVGEASGQKLMPASVAFQAHHKNDDGEGEALLIRPRKHSSVPEGIDNPGLEKLEVYVPSQPHQRVQGPRGQLILERPPPAIPPCGEIYRALRVIPTAKDDRRSPAADPSCGNWSASEDGHATHRMRDACSRLYHRGNSAISSSQTFKNCASTPSMYGSAKSLPEYAVHQPPRPPSCGPQRYYMLKDMVSGEDEDDSAVPVDGLQDSPRRQQAAQSPRAPKLDTSGESQVTGGSSSYFSAKGNENTSKAKRNQQYERRGSGDAQTMGSTTVSESMSVTPPLPPLSPGNSPPNSPKPVTRLPSKYKLSLSAGALHKATPDILQATPRRGNASSSSRNLSASKKSASRRSGGSQDVKVVSSSSGNKKHSSSSSTLAVVGSRTSGHYGRASRSTSHHLTQMGRSLSNIHELRDVDFTSTTTGLDTDSLLDDADVSSDEGKRHRKNGDDEGDDDDDDDGEEDDVAIHDIRQQLEALENMYSEVLNLLGVKNPLSHQMQQRSGRESARPSRKKVFGSLTSLTGRGTAARSKDRSRSSGDAAKKLSREARGVGRRFQRLESHVVTLARSVAHLSSEMRTQHIMFQELESLRREVAQLHEQQVALARHNQAVGQMKGTPGGGPMARGTNRHHNNRQSAATEWENFRSSVPSLTNPARVKKLTKFFGDEPPLLRLFLKKLGYEKYAASFETERIGMIELPYLTEEQLQKIGIPLGPRMRILQEAQMSFRQEHFNIYIV